MDVLNSLLTELKITGSVYFCDFLKAPWKLDYKNEQRGLFHSVRNGRCMFTVDQIQHELLPGDLVFVSPKIDHHVGAYSGDESESLLLCGYCTFEANEDDMKLLDIPPYLVIRHEQLQKWPWIARTLEHLSSEYLSQEHCRELTIDKLSELLIVQLLRAEFGISRPQGIVAALRDRRLEKALTAIHNSLDKKWTLESVSQIASMSRSGFARKFTEIMGINFYQYLTRVRLKRARYSLKHSGSSVSEIAEQVGYSSDLSFVNVFKKHEGITPRAFRIREIK
jgi:AraC family transcriptional activator of mtrCDE